MKVDFPVFNEYFLLEYDGSEIQARPMSRTSLAAQNARSDNLVTGRAAATIDFDAITALKDAMAIHTGIGFIASGGTGTRRGRRRTAQPGQQSTPTRTPTRTRQTTTGPATIPSTVSTPGTTGGMGGGGRGGY